MASLRRDLANSTAYAEAIAALMEKGGTYQDLMEASGLRYNTVRKLVNALHRRKIVRVALWKRGACLRIRLPVWAFGSAPDAARPPRMTDAERKGRYEEKRRAIAQQTGRPVRGIRLKEKKVCKT